MNVVCSLITTVCLVNLLAKCKNSSGARFLKGRCAELVDGRLDSAEQIWSDGRGAQLFFPEKLTLNMVGIRMNVQRSVVEISAINNGHSFCNAVIVLKLDRTR